MIPDSNDVRAGCTRWRAATDLNRRRRITAPTWNRRTVVWPVLVKGLTYYPCMLRSARPPTTSSRLRTPTRSQQGRLRAFVRRGMNWPLWRSVLPLLTALTVGTTIFFSAQAMLATNNQNELSRQAQLSERFSKAVEQLASENMTMKIGGLYSLESVAREGAERVTATLDVLASILRSERSNETFWVMRYDSCPTDIGYLEAAEKKRLTEEKIKATNGGYYEYLPTEDRRVAAEIYSRLSRDVVTVVEGRRPVQLSRACLHGLDLPDAWFVGADLSRVTFGPGNFRGADLTAADISFSNLGYTMLPDRSRSFEPPDFTNANFTDVDFSNVNLDDLASAEVEGATFHNANFERRDFTRGLSRPLLAGANLANSRFKGSNLAGVDLSRVQNLDQADLREVYYNASTKWPATFTPPRSTPCWMTEEVGLTRKCIVIVPRP